MRKSTRYRSMPSYRALMALAPTALLSMASCIAAEPAEGDEFTSSTGQKGLATVYTGQATHYATVSTDGHCSYGTVQTRLFGAMNHTDYANSQACGSCVQVSGPNGSVKVQIVDECPECAPGDVDLSESAFAQLAPLDKGRIPISWQYVDCDVQGPIIYRFKDGTTAWWNAVQIRNAKRGIAKIEALKNGQYITLKRESYNYFIASSGLGAGPFTFRVTDVAGNVITDSGVPLKVNTDVVSPGNKQFP